METLDSPRSRRGALARLALVVAVLTGCGRSEERPGPGDDARPRRRAPAATGGAGEPIRPIEPVTDLDPRRVSLGARLFVDPRVSGDAKVACVDCHLFDKGGSDGKPTPLVGARPPGIVNSPSVFNLAYDYRYGWGAKFATLEDQHDANIKNPLTMATTWEDAAARLRADATYARSFEEAYRSGLTPDNLRDALISYELSLTTPNARFDRFLRGDASAIDDRARQGYALFKSYGCVSCHQGVNVGGNLMERFGVMRDYFAARGHVSDADDGHFAATHDERDRHVFRVPSLRNVALTAPYFHDGSAATLPDAIGVMARYQLGRTLEPDDVARIVAFLETLTGDQPTPPARP